MSRTYCSAAVAVLILLGLPFAVRAHSSETGIDPGTIALRLQVHEPSELIVDQPLIEWDLCKESGTQHSVGGIVVEGDGGAHGLRALEIRVVSHTHLGTTTTLILDPVSLLLVGPAPYFTSCGLWKYSVELDPGTTQPLSQIVLFADPRSPSIGTMAGTLNLAAVLRFTATNSDDTRSISMPLALNLTGSWALAPSGSAMSSGETNLELFAQSDGGAWYPAPSCVAEVTHGGHLCLGPDIAGH